jgi:hypothetical protein
MGDYTNGLTARIRRLLRHGPHDRRDHLSGPHPRLTEVDTSDVMGPLRHDCFSRIAFRVKNSQARVISGAFVCTLACRAQDAIVAPEPRAS